MGTLNALAVKLPIYPRSVGSSRRMIVPCDRPAFPPGRFPTRRKGFANSTLCLLFILCSHSSTLASSSVDLEWDSNPEADIAGYQVSYGTTLGNYPNSVSVGTTPAATVSGLDEGSTYYFVVAAINDAGLQGPYSDVVSCFTPVENPSKEAPDAVNDAPFATSDSVTTRQNTALPVVLSGGDDDSFALTYAVTMNPTHGTLSGTAPNLTYTPTTNFAGTDQFCFQVSDGTLNSPAATIDITVAQSAPTPVASTPSIPPPNLPPVFTSNPLGMPDASEGVAYAGQTMAGSATGPGPVTYWKVSGPAWLNVATDGTLSGSPPLGSSGPNGFIVRAIDSSSLAADTELRIHVGWLPIPWQSTNVGIGQLPGSVTYDAGIFTQTGSGVLDRNRDNFRFTYQMLSGDGEVTAKVSSLQSNGTWVRAGVMIRDSLAQNSRHVFLGLTNTTSYRVLSRTRAGARTTIKSSTTSSASDTWVRLVRSGSRIISYKSANGINWTYVATTKVTLNRDCYIGLVVASGGNAANFTARVSNVTVVP